MSGWITLTLRSLIFKSHEILLFASRDISSIPSAETVRELEKLAADHGLTYTARLPIDIHF
jgi:hypothetical protein